MIVDMKSRLVGSVILAVALVAAGAAQNQPNQGKSEKKGPLFFAKIAADIAVNVQHKSINGFLAIYVDEQDWAAGLKDGDLGPFLKVKEAKPGRSAVFIFSQEKDAAVCVYFDGDSAFAVSVLGGKIEPVAVTKEMLKKGAEELKFSESSINTDDGQPLPAFLVAATSKAPN
jgi:hypothetical protein